MTKQFFDALQKGDWETVKDLYLEAPYLIKEKDEMGATALHYAAAKGNMSLIKFLINDKECDPNAQDKFGANAFHYAAANGQTQVIKYLSEGGFYLLLNSKDNKGATALHYAAKGGDSETINMLIGKGLDKNAVDADGFTPLHEAAMGGHADVVDVLLINEATLEALTDAGETPLLSAIKSGQINVINSLLSNGANDQAKDNEGNTLLHLAAIFGHAEVITLLIKRGVNLEMTNNQGKTALDLAGTDEAKGLLLAYKASLDKGKNEVEAKLETRIEAYLNESNEDKKNGYLNKLLNKYQLQDKDNASKMFKTYAEQYAKSNTFLNAVTDFFEMMGGGEASSVNAKRGIVKEIADNVKDTYRYREMVTEKTNKNNGFDKGGK
jgi:ankyrin repeat protein